MTTAVAPGLDTNTYDVQLDTGTRIHVTLNPTDPDHTGVKVHLLTDPTPATFNGRQYLGVLAYTATRTPTGTYRIALDTVIALRLAHSAQTPAPDEARAVATEIATAITPVLTPARIHDALLHKTAHDLATATRAAHAATRRLTRAQAAYDAARTTRP